MKKPRRKIKLIISAGARPNLMKVSPLIEEIKKHKNIRYHFVYTGQHYDRLMAEVFWHDLGLPVPHSDLAVGSGSHAAQTAKILVRFEKICLRIRPDIVVVVGDVNSTLACALVAAKLGIRTAHVESGLRSFDRSMPEEINRLLTDQISDFLFVTEPSAIRNLIREGVDKKKIHYTGNVMIDTLFRSRGKIKGSNILSRLGLKSPKIKYALLTLHRPSNVDKKPGFVRIINALSELSKEITVVFPVHPRTQKTLKGFGLHNYFSLHNRKDIVNINKNKINCIDPLNYIDFIRLMSGAEFVLTDSGGIQEETTILGVPCLTLRENTERPVTIEKGTNILTGCRPGKIISEAKKILKKKAALKRPSPPKFWDGGAARRIIQILAKEA